MKKKIGILGGSFDPIHFGHLNLGIRLLEEAGLDEVLFVPSSLSPFKESAPPVAAAEHRSAMAKLAIGPVPAFRLLDWELHGSSPAFTIDTVRKLSRDSTLELHLLIGEDHLASFQHWKEAEELIRLAPPFVGTRNLKDEGPLSQITSKLQEALRKARVKIPQFDVSSTEIRKRLSQKRYCGHLVPASVLDYIQLYHLYE